MKRTWRTTICLLMGLILLFAGCTSPKNEETPAPAAAEAPAQEAAETQPAAEEAAQAETVEASKKEADFDTLVYGIMNEPAKLDPQNDTLTNAMFINKQIYNTLVARDDLTGEIVPCLAKSWEWEDNTTLVMHLRDDVSWHDGTKFTSADVLFTLQRYADGAASATLLKRFDGENSIAVDDYTVKIKLRQPYGPALNMLGSVKAAIVSKSYCESVDDVTFSREPIGTGPFKFSEWVTGDHITLVRNEEYWGEKPSIAKAEMRIIIDASARAIEIETGGVDIVDSLTTADIDRFSEGGVEGCVLYTVPGTKVHYLVFNDDDPILYNEKVRLAFAHAIDMETVTDAGFGIGSGAFVARSSMASSIMGFVDQGQYEYNPEMAKQLLAEAGYPDGFSCELVIPESGNNVRMGEAMQAMLAEIGVDMKVGAYYSATWKSMAQDGSAKLSIQNMTVDTYDPDQNYSNLYADSTNKVVASHDPIVNELLEKGRSEVDNEKRKEIYAEIQKYVFEHAIQLQIDEPISNYVTRDYVLGFVPNAGLQPDLTKITINH